MGNLGAFITMKGKDLKPNFTSYEAVVNTYLSNSLFLRNINLIIFKSFIFHDG